MRNAGKVHVVIDIDGDGETNERSGKEPPPVHGNCHQCRQLFSELMATCKGGTTKRHKKPCAKRFCPKCLFNRYGEKVGVVSSLKKWLCPCCRDICNCSSCMKMKGLRPTGSLTPIAKAAGFLSVAHFLKQKKEGKENASELANVKQKPGRKRVADQTKVTLNKRSKLANEKLGSETKAEPKKTEKQKQASQPKIVADVPAEAKSEPKKRPKPPPEKQKPATQPEIVADVPAETKSEPKKRTKPPPEKQKPAHDKSTEHDQAKPEPKKRTKKPMSTEPLEDVHETKPEPKPKKRTRKPSTEPGKCVGANGQETKPEPKKRRTEKQKPGTQPTGDVPAKTKPEPKKRARPTKKAEAEAGAEPRSEDVPVPTVEAEEHQEESETETVPDIVLPPGEKLDTVEGLKLPEQAIGAAFQLLEFCSAFYKALEMGKREADQILVEIVEGEFRRRSPLIRMHTKLLSLLFEDEGRKFPSNGKWLNLIKDYLSAHPVAGMDDNEKSTFLQSLDGDYADVDVQKRLELLNILCDDCLCTSKMRTYISDALSEHENKHKGIKEQLLNARKEAREAFQKKKEAEMEWQNASSLSDDQQRELLEKIRLEREKAANAKMAVSSAVKKTMTRNCDVVRTEPLAVVHDGRKFWRLRGILAVQDVSEGPDESPREKWTCYSTEQEQVLNEYIAASKRLNKSRGQL